MVQTKRLPYHQTMCSAEEVVVNNAKKCFPSVSSFILRMMKNDFL